MTLFEFSDYRPFLKHYIRHLPKGGRGEVSRMAQHLRVNSTLLSQIFSGSKDLTLEQAQNMCEYLALSSLESDYFMLLVQIARAGSVKLKNYFRDKLELIKKESLQVAKRIAQDRVLTDYERSVFYSSWLYSGIRLYTSVGKGKTIDEIAERFDIPRARAVEALRFLASVGLCKEEEGRFKMGAQRTHLEKGSPFLIKHHTNWRIKSLERAESVSDDELMFTAPLSINKKDFARVREEIMGLIKKVSETIKDSEADDVGSLNIDLLWLK
ncbi:MAG: TIGR02147 family protein [Pseudobdellovibrionaceae bacterium]